VGPLRSDHQTNEEAALRACPCVMSGDGESGGAGGRQRLAFGFWTLGFRAALSARTLVVLTKNSFARRAARMGVFSDVYIQVFEKILVFFGFRLLKT
jgi:hypothetical protein